MMEAVCRPANKAHQGKTRLELMTSHLIGPKNIIPDFYQGVRPLLLHLTRAFFCVRAAE